VTRRASESAVNARPRTTRRRALTLLAVAALLLAVGPRAATSALTDDRPGEPRLASPRGTLQLADVAWRLDDLAQPPPARVPDADAPEIRLPWESLGERWSFVFAVDEPGPARLALEWTPAPDGLVFEILINGEPLVPARDGWRPTPRTQVSDLGTRWFGTGRNLVEFVCRETGGGALRLRALELQAP